MRMLAGGLHLAELLGGIPLGVDHAGEFLWSHQRLQGGHRHREFVHLRFAQAAQKVQQAYGLLIAQRRVPVRGAEVFQPGEAVLLCLKLLSDTLGLAGVAIQVQVLGLGQPDLAQPVEERVLLLAGLLQTTFQGAERLDLGVGHAVGRAVQEFLHGPLQDGP